MKKQFCAAILLSLTFSLPVFGEDSMTVQKNAPNETSIIYQEPLPLDSEDSMIAARQHYMAQKGAMTVLARREALPDQPKNRWGISLTPAEFDLLARIVMLEAGGESPLGQQAVAEVVLNRMISPYYGGSLEYVLSARGQFSTWKMRYSSQAAPSPQVIASVNAVLEGETNILPFQTLYFSRKAQNRRVQARIGRHVFCNQ